MTAIMINTAEAKEQFPELVNRVAHNKDRVILTRRGKDIAVIIPIEDFMLLQQSQDRHDLGDAIDALREGRRVGMVTLEELKEEAGA